MRNLLRRRPGVKGREQSRAFFGDPSIRSLRRDAALFDLRRILYIYLPIFGSTSLNLTSANLCSCLSLVLGRVVPAEKYVCSGHVERFSRSNDKADQHRRQWRVLSLSPPCSRSPDNCCDHRRRRRVRADLMRSYVQHNACAHSTLRHHHGTAREEGVSLTSGRREVAFG